MRTEARSNCGGGRARLSERHGRAVLGGRGVRTWRCPHGGQGHQARCPSTWPRRRWATWPAAPIELQRILPAAPPRLARGRCRLTPARPHPCPAAQLPAPQLWRAGCIVPLGRGGSAAPTAKGRGGGAMRVHRTSGTRAPDGTLPQRCRRGIGGRGGVSGGGGVAHLT